MALEFSKTPEAGETSTGLVLILHSSENRAVKYISKGQKQHRLMNMYKDSKEIETRNLEVLTECSKNCTWLKILTAILKKIRN